MNRLILIVTMACFCFAGCKKEEKAKQSGDSSGNPLSAPAEYGAALVKAQKSAQKTVGNLGMDQAIKSFYAEEGRYPKSLDELKAKGIAIPNPPAGMKWDYDPATGAFKPVPQ